MRRWWGLIVVVGLLGLVACSDDNAAPGSSVPSTTADTRFVDLQRARSEIQSAMGDGAQEYRSLGLGDDVVEVRLRADQAALAADLAARYGDLVAITLGNFRWPDPSAGRALEAAACDEPIVAPAMVDGLTATLRLDPGSVTVGADFAGTVTVTNSTSATVAFETGSPVAAVVVATGTTTIVATYDSPIAGVGLSPSLAPGASVDIPVLGGTASCDPALGHALPPGTYDVRVVVPIGPSSGLVSAPATLTVTS